MLLCPHLLQIVSGLTLKSVSTHTRWWPSTLTLQHKACLSHSIKSQNFHETREFVEWGHKLCRGHLTCSSWCIPFDCYLGWLTKRQVKCFKKKSCSNMGNWNLMNFELNMYYFISAYILCFYLKPCWEQKIFTLCVFGKRQSHLARESNRSAASLILVYSLLLKLKASLPRYIKSNTQHSGIIIIMLEKGFYVYDVKFDIFSQCEDDK